MPFAASERTAAMRRERFLQSPTLWMPTVQTRTPTIGDTLEMKCRKQHSY